MAEPRRQESASSIRGIQNTEVRFQNIAQDRLLQERLLDASDKDRFERNQEEEEDEADFQRQQIIEAAQQEEQMRQIRIAQQNAAHRKNLLAKRRIALQDPKATQGFSRFMRASTLLWLGWIQFFFACAYAVSFGLKMAQMAFCDTTVGGAVCTITGVLGEAVGFFGGFSVRSINLIDLMLWCFGGLIAIFTVCILIGVLLISMSQKEKPLNTPFSIIALAFVFMLNMIPVLNLIPWILIWAWVQLMGPALPITKKLSSATKKA